MVISDAYASAPTRGGRVLFGACVEVRDTLELLPVGPIIRAAVKLWRYRRDRHAAVAAATAAATSTSTSTAGANHSLPAVADRRGVRHPGRDRARSASALVDHHRRPGRVRPRVDFRTDELQRVRILAAQRQTRPWFESRTGSLAPSCTA